MSALSGYDGELTTTISQIQIVDIINICYNRVLTTNI